MVIRELTERSTVVIDIKRLVYNEQLQNQLKKMIPVNHSFTAPDRLVSNVKREY